MTRLATAGAAAITLAQLVACGGGGGSAQPQSTLELRLSASSPVAGVRWASSQALEVDAMHEAQRMALSVFGSSGRGLARTESSATGAGGGEWLLYAKGSSGVTGAVLMSAKFRNDADTPRVLAVECADSNGNLVACDISWQLR